MDVTRPDPLDVPANPVDDDRSSASAVAGVVTAGLATLAAMHAEAATFNVTTLADGGPGSLRQAVVDANANPGADVIAFDSALTGAINVTTGQLLVTDSVDVQGPGPAVLSVVGDNASRVFYLYNPSALIDVTISGLTITGGGSYLGGGIANAGENATLDDVVVTGNGAFIGGGVANLYYGNLTVQSSVVTGNGALFGGGIASFYYGGLVSIVDSEVSGNVASIGGGLALETGSAQIANSVITGNEAAGDGPGVGGGIAVYGGGEYYGGTYPADVTISDSTIAANSAVTAGGGIGVIGSVDLRTERTTISGNTAGDGAGIAANLYNGGVDVENSTISGNESAGLGGGIAVSLYDGPVLIRHSTIAGNSTGGTGGGLHVLYGYNTRIESSVIADNSAGVADPDVGQTSTDVNIDVTYSLIETPGAANLNDLGGNIFNQDPQLGPLQDNGGPTETHLPASASPVVNAGDPTFVPPPATDQRGFARVVGAAIDMGAVEVNPGVITIAPTAASLFESNSVVPLQAIRTGGVDGAVSADFQTVDGTAVAPADYTSAAGTVNFASGDATPQPINVTIVDDALVEPAETFSVQLSNPQGGATLGAEAQSTVTINDFEAGVVELSIAAIDVDEAAGTATLTVTRTGGSSGPASVNYAFAGGTAAAGVDFNGVGGTLTWADGDAAPKNITASIVDDTLVESTETFSVTLSGASGATLGAQSTATVSILDNDSVVEFAITAVTVNESAGTASLTVTRTGSSTVAASVNFAFADGTADATDYNGVPGTLNWPGGDTAPRTITVGIIDDLSVESTEAFSVTLSGASGATLGPQSTATISITDNDVAPQPDVPALDGFGKIALAIATALAGMIALGRSRIWGVLLALLLVSSFATAPAEAANATGAARIAALQQRIKANGQKPQAKSRGKIESVASEGGNVTIVLVGGESFTAPAAKIRVVSVKGKGQRTRMTAADLAAGQLVKVRAVRGQDGELVRLRVRIQA